MFNQLYAGVGWVHCFHSGPGLSTHLLQSEIHLWFQAVRDMSAAEASLPLLLSLLWRWSPSSTPRTSWVSLPRFAHQTAWTVSTVMPVLSCPSSASRAVSSHFHSHPEYCCNSSLSQCIISNDWGKTRRPMCTPCPMQSSNKTCQETVLIVWKHFTTPVNLLIMSQQYYVVKFIKNPQ